MQDITWVSRVWEDTLNTTTKINCIGRTYCEAVPAAWILVATKFRSTTCNLEQLLWWEDAYATSFFGSGVSQVCLQPGHFSCMLFCQLTMSWTGVPRSSDSGTDVGSSLRFQCRLLLQACSWELEATHALVSFWQLSGLQNLKPVLAPNPQKCLLWK